MHTAAVDYASTLLKCPITKRKLSEAVSIVPCGCQVNIEVVEKIEVLVGKVFEVLKETSCPVCSKRMSGYFEDLHVRKSSIEFFNLLENSTVEKKRKLEGEFKWIRSTFIKDSDSLIPHSYKTTVENSTVQYFRLFHDSRWCFVTVVFKPSEDFVNLLLSHNIKISAEAQKEHKLQTSDPIEMMKLFELVKKNNDFPEESLEKMKEILLANRIAKPPQIHFNFN